MDKVQYQSTKKNKTIITEVITTVTILACLLKNIIIVPVIHSASINKSAGSIKSRMGGI